MTLLEAAGAISAVAAAVYAAARLGRGARRLGHLLDDLLGAPGHGDQPPRPGVMGQLRHIHDQIAHLTGRVGAIETELHPNGGRSIHDQLARIEHATSKPATPPTTARRQRPDRA